MVDFLRRLMARRSEPEPVNAPVPLTTDRIDAGYRFYWMKTTYTWDAERRSGIAERVSEVIAAPNFENNALERRFHVDGLDEHAHSGASLLALQEVLQALDNFDFGDDNE